MNAKKFVTHLFCLQTVNKRNLTSLGLVAVFFCVYMISVRGDAISLKPPRLGSDGKLIPANAPAKSETGEKKNSEKKSSQLRGDFQPSEESGKGTANTTAQRSKPSDSGAKDRLSTIEERLNRLKRSSDQSSGGQKTGSNVGKDAQ